MDGPPPALPSCARASRRRTQTYYAANGHIHFVLTRVTMFRTALAILAAVPCMILLLPAMVIGLVLRGLPLLVHLIAQRLEPSFVPWIEIMQFDPLLGWRPRPNLNTYYLATRDDVFKTATDNDGWPGQSTLDASRIVVIGDSVAFGYGVNTERSFSEVDPSLGVKAVGAPGYSMVQGVQLMEQLSSRLEGKLVVWFVFLGNDIHDNLRPHMQHYRAPFVRRRNGHWEIAQAHVSAERWECSQPIPDRLPMLAEFCVPGPISDRAYSACAFLIGRADSACREAGAQLVVVSIPPPVLLHPSGIARLTSMCHRPGQFDPTLPDQRISSLCQNLGVPFVAGQSIFKLSDYKHREGIHWNQRGHLRMAVLLRQLLHNGTYSHEGECNFSLAR